MKESSSTNISGRVVRRGAWCEEEDVLLRRCIEKFGEGKWRQVPLRAGLNRCGKSCRLRWINYLQPNIKRGEFEVDELDLIMRMRKLLGNRWSIIAGRLPGRTANDVKNCYNTLLKKKCFLKCNGDQAEQAGSIKSLRDETNNDGRINVRTAADDDCDDNSMMMTKVIKPLPRRLTNKSKMVTNRASASTGMNADNNTIIPSNDFDGVEGVGEGGNDEYWNDLYFDYDSWGALGEENDQHLLSSNDDLLYLT